MYRKRGPGMRVLKNNISDIAEHRFVCFWLLDADWVHRQVRTRNPSYALHRDTVIEIIGTDCSPGIPVYESAANGIQYSFDIVSNLSWQPVGKRPQERETVPADVTEHTFVRRGLRSRPNNRR